jgi:hypothetical protein
MQILKSHLSFRARAGLIIALPMAALAGCQATVNTRWAEPQDSADAWQATMTNIPIDIHGTLPGDSVGLTTNLMGGGTTKDAFNATHPGQEPLEQLRRIELYVNADRLPVRNSYCDAAPSLQSAEGKRAPEMVGALCDGSRLVATEVIHLDSRQSSGVQAPQVIDMFKARLLDGLAADPGQAPYQYEY